MESITRIKDLLLELELPVLFELESFLSKHIKNKRTELTKSLEEMIEVCPHCKSKKIIIWGNYKDQKRYKCKSCKRTFTCTTGSILHNLKSKEKFIRYSITMFCQEYPTIKELSEKIGICHETALQWRHRLLISLGQEAPQFSGLTELDDIWFLYSQKGRKGLKYSRKRGGSNRKGDNDFQAKVLITKERESEMDMSLVRIGRLKAVDLKRKLSGKFTPTAVLISDKHSSISSFAKKEDIKHETFLAKEHVKDEFIHVQTVNNLASRLKNMVNLHLKGVSTKYLQNYATWFSIKEKFKHTKDKALIIMQLAFKNKISWDMYTNIEKLYKEFVLNYSRRTYRCPTKKEWKAQNWNFENATTGQFL